MVRARELKPNRELFPDHLSFILYGALVGTGSLWPYLSSHEMGVTTKICITLFCLMGLILVERSQGTFVLDPTFGSFTLSKPVLH